jgi:hypothetical protein
LPDEALDQRVVDESSTALSASNPALSTDDAKAGRFGARLPVEVVGKEIVGVAVDVVVLASSLPD